MLRVLFLFALSLSSHVCIAQFDSKEDSLLAILRTNKKEDTNRVWTYIRYASAIFYNNPDSAMTCAKESLRISEKIKWQKGIALSYKVVGNAFLVKADYLNALEQYHNALKADNGNSKFFEAGVLGNMGLIYFDLKEYNKAIEYYNKYINIAREVKSEIDEVMGLSNLGDVYNIQEKYAEAIPYYEKALSIAGKIDFQRAICSISNSLAILFKTKGDFSKAKLYQQRSLDIADSLHFDNIKAPGLNNMAEIYLGLNDYKNAKQYNQASLELSNELNNLKLRSNVYNTSAMIYGKSDEYEKAYAALKQYIVLHDSLITDEKMQELTRKEVLFEKEKEQAVLNANHSAESKRQRIVQNFLIFGAGFILLVSGLLFLSYKRRRDAKGRQKEAELKAEISDTEMKALRAQMNPHFIFNSLNSISDYITKNKTELADEYLTKFAKLMRLILENSEQKEVPLIQDLKALELYMQLESLRMNNKFSYEINVDEEIDKENTLVPPLLLQPFVENSIWHGIAKKEGLGKILVQIKKEDGMISCIVEDNGIGRKGVNEITFLKDNTGRRSLGMKITKERIDIINKVKKATAEVKLTDLQQGTRVEVKLPLELSF